MNENELLDGVTVMLRYSAYKHRIISSKMNKRNSLDFGKKEKVLNYATQTCQLSRPNKVGAVMALIRECQPQIHAFI